MEFGTHQYRGNHAQRVLGAVRVNLRRHGQHCEAIDVTRNQTRRDGKEIHLFSTQQVLRRRVLFPFREEAEVDANRG